MALVIEEKYDQVRQLISIGKERGYLLYDEVNDILPPELHSSAEIDETLSAFERYGIDVTKMPLVPRPLAMARNLPISVSQSRKRNFQLRAANSI